MSAKVEQALGKVKQSVGETLGNEKLANLGSCGSSQRCGQGDVGQCKRRRQRSATVAPERFNRQGTREAEPDQSVGKNAKDKASEKIEEFKERHSA